MDRTPLATSPHRTTRLLLLAMVALLTACGRPAAQAPAPTATWWSASAAATATPTPAATPAAQVTASPAEPTPRPTATPLTQPAVVGAYVTSYLPGWGERPAGITVLGGRVYVANQDTHNVSIIADDAVERVLPVGTSPGPIVADPASGRVFVLNQGDGTVSVIDGGRVAATWELPEACTALAVAGGRLWVGSAQGGRIHLLALDNGAQLGEATIDTGSSALAMVPSPDEAVMYVASYNRTTALDVATLAEVAHAELNSYATLAVSADGTRVYVNDFDADEGASSLVALDAATLEEVDRLPVPPDPAAALAAPKGDHVYLLSGHANAVLAIDGAARELLATVPVGLDPRHLALDPASGRLYIANQLGDSVAVVDAERLEVVETVPLSARVEAMTVDPADGALYAAVSSSDRVFAFGEGGLRSAWYVGRHPGGVAALPDGGLAVLLRAEARLALLDPEGVETASYPTGRHPMGLTVDATQGRIYAGDLLVDLATGVTETVSAETVTGAAEPPVRVTIDTRRERAYALAFNGVPGTNGGTVAGLLADGVADLGAAAPGRLGIGQLVYDAATDRFYATTAHLTDYGLQVSDAKTLQEVSFLPLDRRPSAAALNASTQHLWLALPAPNDAAQADTHLVAIDTRNLGTAAEVSVAGRVRSLTVDAEANLVYAGVDGTGDIVIVQDVAMPAPPKPATLQTPAPAATAEPETSPAAAANAAANATATAAATAAPTRPASTEAPTLTPVPVLSPTPTREDPCSRTVDARLQEAYDQFGEDAMGCPRADAVFGDWAWQPFERGDMLWHGSSGVIYVFEEEGGWRGYTDDWHEGMPDLSCEADPPAGLLQPVRGFGRIWCLVGEAREAVGWAAEPETAVDGISQEFDGGVLMEWAGNLRLLRGDGTWVAP